LGRETKTHLGLAIREGAKYKLKIERETYALIDDKSSHFFPRELNPALWDEQNEIFEDPGHLIYSPAWCLKHQQNALLNFDLNMKKYAELKQENFESCLNRVLAENPKLQLVSDLNDWQFGRFVYIMVLDEFKQAYVGIARGAGGLKSRIRQHWSGNKKFDRLIHGAVETSKISIDSFRALDTTRVFAMECENPASTENAILELFHSDYVLNRISGGTPKSHLELELLDAKRAKFVALEG